MTDFCDQTLTNIMDKTSRLTTYLIRARLRYSHPSMRTFTTAGVNDDNYRQSDTDDKPGTDSNALASRNISLSLLEKRMITPRRNTSGAARTGIVINLFTLSQSVLDGKLSVDEFMNSQTFQKLQSHMDTSIDSFTDSQIINILSSLLRMKVKVDLHLVRLLEHEVKFRLKKLSLNNIIKLLYFYKSIKLTIEQNQLVELLGFRIQKDLQYSPNVTLKDINLIIRLTRSSLIPRSWLSLVDERLLSMLIRGDQMDSAIDRILNTDASFDYSELCRLFIELAECKRRPTPVLRAATMVLLSTPITKDDNFSIDILMDTLNALISLSYPNTLLVKKLIDDLKNVTDLGKLDSQKRIAILEILTSLRWNDPDIIEAFVIDLTNNPDSGNNCPYLASRLVQTCANFGYASSEFNNCYKQHIRPIEGSISKKSHQQRLRYMWSLANLDLVTQEDLRDFLDSDASENMSDAAIICDSNTMKLLNLYFIARHHLDITDLVSQRFNHLGSLQINKSSIMKKISTKMQEAMNGIIEDSSQICNNIQTPFGFIVDSEIWLNQELKPMRIDAGLSLASIKSFDIDPNHYGNSREGIHKCAVICTSFEDIIVNQPNRVIGHRQMAAKILKKLGYIPIFMNGNAIANLESGADMQNLLQTQVELSLNDEDLKFH